MRRSYDSLLLDSDALCFHTKTSHRRFSIQAKNNRFHFNSRCYTDNGMCLLYEVHIVVNIRDHSWVTKLTNQFSRVMFVVLCVSVPCHCCARVAMMPTSLSRVASEVVAMTKLTSWWLRAVIIPTLSSLALKPPLVSSMTKKVGTVTAPVYQWRGHDNLPNKYQKLRISTHLLNTSIRLNSIY